MAGALLAAAPAAAAKKADDCGRQVFLDWYDNNRVDKIYPQHCYRDAVKQLPVDIKDYSSASEDILRALAYAQQGKSDPGDNGSGGTTGTGGGTTGGSGGGTTGGGTTGGGTTTDPGSGSVDGGVEPGSVDTSGPSAVPVPLIVLASIAGLLLLLGAAGYLKRRAAARHADGPPTA